MRRLIIAGVFSIVSSIASADGLPERYRERSFSWTGLYVGMHTGWERGQIQGFDDNYNRFDRQHVEGWLGGGQFGYNHQIGHVVLGTELSGSWGTVKGIEVTRGTGPPATANTGPCFPGNLILSGNSVTCEAKQTWTVQWLNRLGVAFGPESRLLGYVEGGIAITELQIDRSLFSAPAVFVKWTGSTMLPGALLGGGLQYAITNNISIGFEYLHTQYATATILTAGNSSPPLAGHATEQLKTDTARLVVNYKFGK